MLAQHRSMGVLLGLAAALGFLACALDTGGTAGSPPSSSTQASSGSQGGNTSQGGGGAAGGAGGAGDGGAGAGTTSSGTGGGGQGGGTTCGALQPSNPTVFDCDTPNSCIDTTIDCPPGGDCIVNCTAQASCKGNTVITCPWGHICRVICSGTDACQDARIECAADGVCELQCSNHAQVCSNTRLNCGEEWCGATCGGASHPIVECNGSCKCGECD